MVCAPSYSTDLPAVVARQPRFVRHSHRQNLSWDPTPTEASAFGAFGALLLAGAKRKLTPSSLYKTLLRTTHSTCMITMILLGASIFGYFFTLSHVRLELFYRRALRRASGRRSFPGHVPTLHCAPYRDCDPGGVSRNNSLAAIEDDRALSPKAPQASRFIRRRMSGNLSNLLNFATVRPTPLFPAWIAERIGAARWQAACSVPRPLSDA
jgi:hypothetical protein